MAVESTLSQTLLEQIWCASAAAALFVTPCILFTLVLGPQGSDVDRPPLCRRKDMVR